MTRAELVTRMAQAAELTKRQAEKTLRAFLSSVQEALSTGQRVTVVGMGRHGDVCRALSRRAQRAASPQWSGDHRSCPQETHVPGGETPTGRGRGECNGDEAGVAGPLDAATARRMCRGRANHCRDNPGTPDGSAVGSSRAGSVSANVFVSARGKSWNRGPARRVLGEATAGGVTAQIKGIR
jgi:nucleoid DNA-binding protein